jgi:preprotein translocase subunit SecG
MIVSAINWLSISINLLLAIFVIVCILMSMIILMQRPKNEGLGAAFGSGATDQLFGARTTNVLQKATVWLGSLFFLLTLVLAVLVQKKNSDNPTLIAKVAPPAAAPAEPEKPASIAEEAEKAGEKPLEPEAVTPPAEAPASTPVAPVETPATETAPAPETTPAPETAPAEQTPPPAEEQKAPEGQ